MRDFAVLTSEMPEADRNELALDLIPALQDRNALFAEFESAKDLEKFLQENAQRSCYRFFTCDPRHLDALIDRAGYLEKNIDRLIWEKGALFYDFKNQNFLPRLETSSPDLFVSAKGALSVESFEKHFGDEWEDLHHSEETIGMLFQAGATASPLKTGDSIVQQLDFDLAKMPLKEILQNKPAEFSGEDFNNAISLFSSLDQVQAIGLINSIFELAKRACDSNDSLRSCSYDASLALIDLSASLISSSFSYSEIIAFLNELLGFYRNRLDELNTSALLRSCGLLKGESSSKAKKAARDQFAGHYDLVSFIHNAKKANQQLAGLKEMPDFRALEQASSLEQLSFALHFSYLDSKDLVSFLNLIDASDLSLHEARFYFADLAFKDIKAILEFSLSDSSGRQNSLAKKLDFYRQHPDGRYLKQKAYIQNLLSKNSSLYPLSYEMIATKILVESAGNPSAQNGRYTGLMQIGPEAAKSVTGTNFSVEQMKVHFGAQNWQGNVNLGSRYYKNQFVSLNAAGSWGIALVNYNAGVGRSLQYKAHHVFGASAQQELPEETQRYLCDQFYLLNLMRQKERAEELAANL
ncbi:MAG: lytic transglycosylase domain-containing protein [Deltaproteobacteria bacterium]|nr:lytic transglycosylase domain-containing protein [Deltaproteobacteria bacterium]